MGPVQSATAPNGFPAARCSRPADQEALRIKQLVEFVEKSRSMAVQNPLLLADVGYYEAELAASRQLPPGRRGPVRRLTAAAANVENSNRKNRGMMAPAFVWVMKPITSEVSSPWAIQTLRDRCFDAGGPIESRGYWFARSSRAMTVWDCCEIKLHLAGAT